MDDDSGSSSDDDSSDDLAAKARVNHVKMSQADKEKKKLATISATKKAIQEVCLRCLLMY